MTSVPEPEDEGSLAPPDLSASLLGVGEAIFRKHFKDTVAVPHQKGRGPALYSLPKIAQQISLASGHELGARQIGELASTKQAAEILKRMGIPSPQSAVEKWKTGGGPTAYRVASLWKFRVPEIVQYARSQMPVCPKCRCRVPPVPGPNAATSAVHGGVGGYLHATN